MIKRKIAVWAALLIVAAAVSIMLGYGLRLASGRNTETAFGSEGSCGTAFAQEPSGALNSTTVLNPTSASNLNEAWREAMAFSKLAAAPTVPCLYFNETSFAKAAASAIIYKEDTTGLKGGIVPHHLLAGRMISSFWKTVSQKDYDLIVIIGPDHNRRGKYEITTITSGFTAINGDVAVNKDIANALIQRNLALEDPELMESEHSVATHIPFISYYMPDTPVLPLLVKGSCSAGKVRNLADNILEITDGLEVLFVASVDFSHYLPLEEANEKDRYTEQVLAGFDYDSIMEMTNDHLDSRPSVLYLLHTMSELGSKSMEKWAHSNSDIIAETNTGYTTSYFVFGFFDVPNQYYERKESSINSAAAVGELKQNQTAREWPVNNTDSGQTDNNPIEAGEKSYTGNMAGEKNRLQIIAVGDIMLGRGVASSLKAQRLDFIHPFTEVKSILDEGDIVFGNLEHPITESAESLDSRFKYILKSETGAATGLSYAGFDVLSIANNHIMDYYETGLMDTLSILEENNILPVGAGRFLDDARKPVIFERNGIKVGFLAYTDMADIIYTGNPSIKFAAGQAKAGVAPLKLSLIEEDIGMLRSKVDIIAVSLHWGVEDCYDATEEQIALAHKICDFGADIILGHHPHRFQGIEIYQGKPIIYSLGNFIFDQIPENQESFIVSLVYQGSDFSAIKAIPVRTVNHSLIVRQKGIKAEEMLERVVSLSKKLGTEFTVENDSLICVIGNMR